MKFLARNGIAMILLIASAVVEAQTQAPRVGILVTEISRSESQLIKGIGDEIKTLGYRVRKTIFLETRNAKGDRGGLQPAAIELVAKKVDALITFGTSATLAARAATRDIPIVFVHPADPIALGLVAAMEKPGGNVTGVAGFSEEMTEQRLQKLKKIISKLQRVHVFYDAKKQSGNEIFSYVETVAAKLGLQAVRHGIKTAEELKVTVQNLKNGAGDALFHVPDDLVEGEADFVLETARKNKLPTMFTDETWSIKGAMAAYGPSYYEMGRQAARLVQMIVTGRKAETIPIQRAAKFDLILNYRTANLIGVTLNQDILREADKVIR
jgi:putative ABC transport system substrate-binding protein